MRGKEEKCDGNQTSSATDVASSSRFSRSTTFVVDNVEDAGVKDVPIITRSRIASGYAPSASQLKEADEYALKLSLTFAYKAYEKIPEARKAQDSVEDLRSKILLHYSKYRLRIDFDQNWQGLIGKMFKNAITTAVSTSYDRYSQDRMGEDQHSAVLEYDDDDQAHVVPIDDRDAETQLIGDEEDHRLKLLRDRIRFYCVLFKSPYSDDVPLESLVGLLQTLIHRNILSQLVGRVRDELDDLRQVLEDRGIRLGLNKGGVRARNVVQIIRKLFDEGIINRRDIIDHFEGKSLYYNRQSIRTLIAGERRRRGLPAEGREETRRERAVNIIVRFLSEGNDDATLIHHELERYKLSNRPSHTYSLIAEIKKSLRKNRNGVYENSVSSS